jgi:hypothetical protein
MRVAQLSRKGWIARLTPWFSTEKATVVHEFNELRITQARLIIGHGHRLRDVTGLYLLNGIKLAEVFLDLASTPGKIHSFDWECSRFQHCSLPPDHAHTPTRWVWEYFNIPVMQYAKDKTGRRLLFLQSSA